MAYKTIRQECESMKKYELIELVLLYHDYYQKYAVIPEEE